MKNVFMAQLTTLGIGGRAREVVAPDEAHFFQEYDRLISEYGKVLVLGRGSKVLCADEGYNGGVVLTRGLDRVRFDGENVYAGAGIPLARLARAAAERGLSGLEWAVGIPASLGGAVTLNAGAYGGEMSDLVTEVVVRDGEMNGSECGFVYRGSAFDRGREIVTGAWLHLTQGDRDAIEERMRACTERRRATQPVGARTAGSVFRRADGVGAGVYIDRAKLKGTTIGGAAVSNVHANFIENRGGATCQDVRKLLDCISTKVRDLYGVELIQDIIEV